MDDQLSVLAEKIRHFAHSTPHIIAVLLVGSYARNAQKEDSDIDLVIVAEHKDRLLKNPSWIRQFGILEHFQFENYGEITSIRAFFKEYEVEFGIGSPQWIALPLDAGTREVVNDGYKIIYDRDGMLQSTLTASGID